MKRSIALHLYAILRKPFSIIISGLLCILSTPVIAQGDLLVFPKRIVFEGGKKAESINLSNIGKDTAKYIISFVQIRMNEDGSFSNIDKPDPGQFFADSFIRYYPRTVTLAPGESQLVKLQLTRTNRLTPGEYRSHIYFRAKPASLALTNADFAADTNSVSVKIIPVYGITIPTIIRVGESNAQASITNVFFERDLDNKPVVSMEINRTGNMSVYGSIAVQYFPTSGKPVKVGEASGVAVYTPGTKRKFTIKLQQPEGVDYAAGKIKITYSTPPGSKSIRLAEAEVTSFPEILSNVKR